MSPSKTRLQFYLEPSKHAEIKSNFKSKAMALSSFAVDSKDILQPSSWQHLMRHWWAYLNIKEISGSFMVVDGTNDYWSNYPKIVIRQYTKWFFSPLMWQIPCTTPSRLNQRKHVRGPTSIINMSFMAFVDHVEQKYLNLIYWVGLTFEIKGFFLGTSPPYFLVKDAACN